MLNNQLKGKKGESLAKNFLIKKGYTVVDTNFRAKTGEIDIVAKKNETIVFIEVKSRSTLSYGYPYEAVGYKKQQKIINTAQYYILLHKLSTFNYRFDIIEVFLNQSYRINHIENAFWM